tara:strand:- start:463 stop:2019 length:1557 start_codon:yes stop_codon:yes gene_type:complete
MTDVGSIASNFSTVSLCGGFVVGLLVHYGIKKIGDRNSVHVAEERSKLILEKARQEAISIEKEIRVKTAEEQLLLQRQLEDEAREKRQKLNQLENQLLQKDSRLERKAEDLEEKESVLKGKTEELETKANDLDVLQRDYVKRLEEVGNLDQDSAKSLLLERVETDFKYDIEQKMKSVVEACKEEAKDKCVNLLSQTVQKVSVDYKSEGLVSVIALSGEDMKGRIIGREGRNIRAFEQITGIDVIIDDTPDVVVLSGFNAVRRAIATRTMEKLLEDGRIHPARIEEVHQQVTKEVEDECAKAGDDAAARAGVNRLNKGITKELGKLKFRTSYGQNVLEHSIECSKIAGILASEIGVNVKLAKRAALLHDLGKVIDGDESSHAKLGADVARKHGEKAVVVNAIEAHHEEVTMESPIAFLVAASDAISASRRGARSGQTENYLERLQNLEEIATSFDGVNSAYAIQAGREVRVLVNPEIVDDTKGIKLSHQIVQRIEDELDYPGQIKVVVVRENRYVDYAF